MAVLTALQLAELRRAYAATGTAITVDKPTANTVFQAVEDYFENTSRSGFGGAIAAVWATSTTAQKKAVVGVYLGQKMKREGF